MRMKFQSSPLPIGGTHICGDAEFTDGRKYRFVIQNGAVVNLFIYKGKDYSNSDYVNRSRMRAQMVATHALPLLPRALEEMKAREAARDAKDEAERIQYLREEALEKAAPDLLAECQRVLLDFEIYQTQDANHLSVEIVARHIATLKRIIRKATKIKTA